MKLDYRLDKWDYLLLTTFFFIVAVFIIPSLDAGYHNWQRSILSFLLEMLIAIPLTILNVKFLMPFFFEKNKIWYYFPALIIIIAPFIFFYNYLVHLFWHNNPEILVNHGYKLERIGIFIWALLRHVTIMSLVLIIRRLVDAKKQIENLELEKKKLELEMLKSQINPHFYFNTLNNIYSMVLQNSKKIPEMILKLSNLMEYVIYDCKNEFVVLEKELNFLENYFALQKLRYDATSNISFSIDSNNEYSTEVKIIPMLLIQFLENAFKHSNLNEDNSFVKIKINLIGNILNFEVLNTFEDNRTQTENIEGIGILNSRNRLENYYQNNYNLKIVDFIDDNSKYSQYKILLKINL